MMTVNMHEAKTQLSRLVAYAKKGEEIVIAKAGNPVARLTAYTSEQKRRTPNLFKGDVEYYSEFDRADDEIVHLFESGN